MAARDANAAHQAGEEIPLRGTPVKIAPDNDGDDHQDDASPGDEWSRPEPLGRDAKPVPFPVETLPTWVSDFVKAEAASTQTPMDMAGMFALGGLAAALGGYVRVQAWSGFVEACNLYVAVALPPSELKSPVHRHVCAPLEKLEQTLRDAAEPRIRDAETQRDLLERRLKRSMDAAAKAGTLDRDSAETEAKAAREELDACKVPAIPRLIVDDCTLEQLKTLLAEQGGRLAMLSAESTFFGNVASKRYSDNPNLEAALAAHSGDTLRVDRRGRSEVIQDPRLTICIAVQPSVLTDAARSEAAKGRGLFARFLYSLPTPNVGYRDLSTIPPEVPELVRDAWHHNVLTLAQMARKPDEPIQLRLSDEARQHFQHWRAQMEPHLRPGGRMASLEGWAGKLHGHVLRLAGILHFADGVAARDMQPEVGVAVVQRAIELARYFTRHAMLAFDAMGDDEDVSDMRAVLAWIRSNEQVRKDGGFPRTTATKAFTPRLNREKLTAALKGLCDRGYLKMRRIKPESGRGRPADHYEVNPHAH